MLGRGEGLVFDEAWDALDLARRVLEVSERLLELLDRQAGSVGARRLEELLLAVGSALERPLEGVPDGPGASTDCGRGEAMGQDDARSGRSRKPLLL